jgi:hypothetical protein
MRFFVVEVQSGREFIVAEIAGVVDEDGPPRVVDRATLAITAETDQRVTTREELLSTSDGRRLLWTWETPGNEEWESALLAECDALEAEEKCRRVLRKAHLTSVEEVGR